ncbi:MAG TPA: glycoside hydrolase family 38 C-terminal domain-containing protein [Fimbriimonadaceae bacterium]|jgi:alpha-mannosidase
MNPVAKGRISRVLSTSNTAAVDALLKRAEIQIEFAEAFIEAAAKEVPTNSPELVKQARAKLENFDPTKGLPSFQKLVAEIEQDLKEIGQAAKKYTIHCVGHGHIDMNWMWSWPETVSMTHDTFASVLNFMKLYPDFTYSQSQASVYAAIEKHHPAMFKEIQERVKEGRWEVTAVHWVEGDKNLASGEALCRHLLYTREYFKEKFHLAPEDVPIDWEPDTFGHANTIPSILAQGGVKFYYSCRTGGGVDHPLTGQPRPPLFYWEAPNGARVLVNRETTWYNSYVNIGDDVAMPMVEFVKQTKLHEWLNIYGIGNHGGGPTKVEIDYLKLLDTFPIYPRVIFSTCKTYYERVEKEAKESKIELPVLNHELNYEFTGCYTSQSLIKQANRFGENYCVEAETLSLISGHENRKPLRDAWRNVLFNHFHDILPGSGVRETREHATGLFQEVGAITGAIKREALKGIGREIDTYSLLPKSPEAEEEKAEGTKNQNSFEAGSGIGAGRTGYSQVSGGGKYFKAFVVYNPCAWARSEPIKVALYDTDFNPENVVALDEKGVAYPTVFLAAGEDWGHKKITMLFYAQDVPALGYKTYLLCEGAANANVPLIRALNNETFETPQMIIEFDRQSGGLKQARLKATSQEFSNGGFGTWRNVVEHDKFMSAWILGEEVERKNLRSSSFHTYGPRWNIGTTLPEGPGAIAGRAESTLDVLGTKSSVQLNALVHPLQPRLDFEAVVDWREIGDKTVGIPGLLVDFETSSMVTETIYETPFGTVTHKPQTRAEIPSLRFCHVKLDTGGAFTLLQDCKYGFETYDQGLKMRVVRSSFNPDHAPEVAQTNLRYAVQFHSKSPSKAELCRMGAAWNHPFIVSPLELHNGKAPTTRSFAEVATPNVVLSSLKQAEHQDGIVLRLTEYEGKETEAVLTLDPTLTAGKSKAECVDLMERATEGDAKLEGNRVTVTIKPNSFVSLLLS